MKLWRCDWVPSSVADWLSRELEDRGIPGTVYTHTLLSLLHPYFCPHPVPQNSYNSSNCPLETEGLQPILKAGLSRGIKVFYEELEDYVHPDADFPDLNLADHIKEGTRRSKKRQKRKLQDLTSTPEKLWKVAALQCLLTSSDEHHTLTSIVEELFLRLKNSQKVFFQKKDTPYTGESQVNLDYFLDCENIPSSAITDLNTSYCFNFPPLTQLPENSLSEDKNIIDWKSLIKNKLSPAKNATITQKIKSPNDVRRNLESAFLDVEKKNIKLEMDIGFENFNDNQLHENKASCFIPIAPDTLSFFSAEEFAVANNILDGIQMNADNIDVVSSNIVPDLPKENFEEWECAGDVLPKSENRAASVDLLGFRLFERSVESAGSSRCNSNGGIESFEEERMKYVVVDAKSAGPVWGGFSDSLAEQPNQVWQSQTTLPSKLQATIPSGIFNSFGDYPNLNIHQHTNSQEYLNTQFLLHDSSWGCSKEWDSMTELNSKNDSLFSSTFESSPHTAYQKVNGQDSKTSLSEINNERAKNIWSDFNDNDIPSLERASIVSENRINSDSTDFLRNGMEENLCESFQQLGLEQIWQNTVLPANSNKSTVMPDNTNCDASSVTFQDPQCEDNMINQSEHLFTSNDLCSIKLSPEESEEKFVLSSIPRGPSGPYVELKHTEASGFDTVVPHKGSDEIYDDSLSLEKELVLTPKGTNIAVPLETSIPSQEEENLLTSPRTHFRPIWQDKRGSNVDEKLDEGKAFLNAISSIEDADLVFQRTESGTLFLENDRLNGSPKKYMVYLEPPIKTAINLDSSNINEPLVPNTKNQTSSSPFVPKFKIINNEKFCQTDENSLKFGYLYEEMQSQAFPSKVNQDLFQEKSTETLWESQYPKYMKEIWEKETKILEKEAWELELTSATEVFPKWSSSELKAANWSSESNIQSAVSDSFINVSGNPIDKSKEHDEDNMPFSKIKLIWHEPPITKSSLSPAAFTDSHLSGLSEIPKKDSWDFHLSNNTLIDQKYCEKKQISLPLINNPWNVDIPLQKQEFSAIKYDNTSSNYEKSENTPLWQLQWEVDQEADEILGRLIPSSPLKGSPSFYNESSVAIQSETEDFNFMEFLEGQECQQPVEDLDNLEPGWDLNEGFEWLSTAEQGVEDEDNEGREVLFYENEDGQTVMVPVEYLDNTLYDEIFGADNHSPIGGSLPDLPHGQLGEWKKLTRHAHGSRYVPPSRRPCSFFLEGNCRRSDCKFSHDLSTITCRFWEEGSCLKGETCPFRHGFLPSRRRNRSEGDQVAIVKEGIQGSSKGRPIPKRIRGSVISVSSFELDSETDFPCLGSSIESKSEILEEQSLPSNVKITKLAKKKKKFITVTKNAFKDAEGDLKANTSSKSRKTERHKSKRVKSQNLLEATSEDCEKRNAVSMGKEKSDCESLRKILRKRSKVLSHQVYSYEDGTVSDF